MTHKSGDEGLAAFQLETCSGCPFVDEPRVGTGLPCCQYGGRIIMEKGICTTRRDREVWEAQKLLDGISIN